MKLLTTEIERKLRRAPMGSTDGKNIAPVLVKFFTPDSSWTWYVLEGELNTQEGWTFFGLVDGHDKELGYFTLSELQAIRGGIGLPIERDMYYDGYFVNKSTNEVFRGEK